MSAWDGVVRLRTTTLGHLAARHGGRVGAGGELEVRRFVPVDRAGAGDLAPVLTRRFLRPALEARRRGAALLVDAGLVPEVAELAGWVHEEAAWAMAEVLEA